MKTGEAPGASPVSFTTPPSSRLELHSRKEPETVSSPGGSIRGRGATGVVFGRWATGGVQSSLWGTLDQWAPCAWKEPPWTSGEACRRSGSYLRIFGVTFGANCAKSKDRTFKPSV